MTQSESAYAQEHPPAPPPHHQSRPQQRQRPSARSGSKSGFSFRSHKSQESHGSVPKIDLHETPREKKARRLSTKADPRLAMSEAEPSAVASDQASLLAPLRGIQHRDMHGLPIADPDRSNPTRSRWERPLDTIRSFEAAMDGNYSRRPSRYDAPPDSRRSSYYAGSTVNGMTPRNYQDNGYGGRGQPSRNNSYGNLNSARTESYYNDNGNGNNNNGYFPNRARYPRHSPERPNGHAQSYETVTTAAGSGSSGEPLGYSTDPSSDNSSFDRAPSNGQHNGYQNKQQYANGYHSQDVPQPPVKDRAPPRVPIKLGTSSGGPTQYEAPKPVADKRKSWFSKRFSKS